VQRSVTIGERSDYELRQKIVDNDGEGVKIPPCMTGAGAAAPIDRDTGAVGSAD
jgi:hypothetical protein